MARLKKQKYRSFLVSPSSSFAEQTVYVTFILLLFPSTSISQETEEYFSTFCFAKREGECTNDWNDDAMHILFKFLFLHAGAFAK